MEIAEILQYLTAENALKVIGALSIIAAITPTPIDNAILAGLKKIITLGAFNFWFAKNDPEAEKLKK